MKVAFEKDIIELCARVSLFKLWSLHDSLKLHVEKCQNKEDCEFCEMLSNCESVIRFTLHIQASANKGIVSHKYWGREPYNNHTWFDQRGEKYVRKDKTYATRNSR